MWRSEEKRREQEPLGSSQTFQEASRSWAGAPPQDRGPARIHPASPSPASPLDSAAKLFIRRRRARSSTRGSAVFLSVSNAKNGKGGSREDHSTGPRTASVYTSIYIGPIGNVSQR